MYDFFRNRRFKVMGPWFIKFLSIANDFQKYIGVHLTPSSHCIIIKQVASKNQAITEDTKLNRPFAEPFKMESTYKSN